MNPLAPITLIMRERKRKGVSSSAALPLFLSHWGSRAYRRDSRGRNRAAYPTPTYLSRNSTILSTRSPP